MSYGAPWEWGGSAAGTMPQRDMEAPGLVPDVSGVGLSTKKARRNCHQCGQWQWHQEEKVPHKERSLVDRDCCLDVIAEAVDGHRQELKVRDLARA